MTYEAWRISHQSSEQAARAAYAECVQLRAKIEDAEKDIALKEKIIDALGSKLSDVANERYALRIKIEAMEKQEPIVEVRWAADIPNGFLVFTLVDGYLPKLGDKFYALPGAKGE